MTNLEKALHRKLYRGDCPSAEILHDYYWHDLLAEQVEKITGHMAICLDCSAEYAQLVTFLVPVRKPVPIQTAWIPTFIAQLKSLTADGLSPRFALRGDSRRQNLMYETGDQQILLLNWWQDEQAYFTLSSSLFPPPPTIEHKAVTLTPLAGGDAQTADLPTDGEFVFSQLDAGIYQLTIQLPEQKILIPHIKIAVRGTKEI